MTDDSNLPSDDGARGARLAAASVLGFVVPLVLPLAVLVVAIRDRRDMRHGRRKPEPPFLHRAAIGVSLVALLAQLGGLALVGAYWLSHSPRATSAEAIEVAGDPCVAAERCCATLHGADAEECRELGERAGTIQSTRSGQMTAIERSVCTQALQSMRGDLLAAERPVPETCSIEPGRPDPSAK